MTFTPAALPANESERLQALRDLQILDTPPEQAFDDLARVAAHICGTPISLVSLVDAQRQWFKSHVGIDASETPRDVSFCGHAILKDELFVVSDASADPRFAENPLVTSEPGIRFYAGVPLLVAGGHAVGTLCVIDEVPRELTSTQKEALIALGRQAVTQLTLRRQLIEVRRQLEHRSAAEFALPPREAVPKAPPTPPRRAVGLAAVAAALLLLGGAVLGFVAARRHTAAERKDRLTRVLRRGQAATAKQIRGYDDALSRYAAAYAAGAEDPGEGLLEPDSLGEVPSIVFLAADTRGGTPVLDTKRAGGSLGEALQHDSQKLQDAAREAARRGHVVFVAARARNARGEAARMFAFFPVRQGDADPSAAAAPPQLLGWAHLDLPPNELLPLPELADGEVAAELRDRTLERPGERIAGSLPEEPPGSGVAEDRMIIAVAKGSFGIAVRTLPAFDPEGLRLLPYAVLFFGATGAALGLALAWMLQSTQRRARELGLHMTQAVRDREEEVRAVLEGVRSAILTVDATHTVRSFNPTAETLFGRTSPELLGTSIDSLVPDASATPATGVARELLGRCGDSARVPVEVSCIPLPGMQQGSRLFVVRDIAARRHAEAALRASEERYRDLVESAHDLIQVVARDGHYLYTNRAWREALGYAPEEVYGLNVVDVLHADDRDRYLDITRRVLDGETVDRFEVRLAGKGGGVIEAEGSVTSRAVEGDRVSTRTIFRDVTVRRRAERALKDSETYTRAVIDNMLGGLVTIDLDGRIETANRAAEVTFGYPAGGLTGHGLSALVSSSGGLDSGAFLAQARARALGRVTEWEGRRRDGRVFPFELALFAFVTPQGERLGGSVRDISERREVERVKNEFIATVSHELRTPLTSIRGSLSLLALGAAGPLPAEAAEMVTIAERNTLHLVTLINDILDLERLASGKLDLVRRPVRLDAACGRAFDVVQAVADAKTVRLSRNVAGVEVFADADRLLQVLVNLLSNAVKFSPPGSEVAVRVRSREGAVRVEVADRGRGIPESEREAIFERFRQGEHPDSHETGGSGLGLAIAKAIVERHGGHIGVDSTVGEGSTFWFDLPVPSAAEWSV